MDYNILTLAKNSNCCSRNLIHIQSRVARVKNCLVHFGPVVQKPISTNSGLLIHGLFPTSQKCMDLRLIRFFLVKSEGILYFADWTGLDCLVKRGLVKRGLVKRGLFSFFG